MSAVRSTSVGPIPKIAAMVACILLLASACGESSTPLDPEVARQFDIANNSIANLTEPGGGEAVPFDDLVRSVSRADAAGTELRIVVAAADGEFVSAKSVVDRYGGTAISYQANQTGFEGASRDMSGGQLDRAIGAAKQELDLGDSAAAFVDVIASEGLERRGSSLARTTLLILLVPAALFMFSGAWSYLQARKRRIKRRSTFDERKWVLTDWANQLGPEVESLRPLVSASSDTGAKQVWSVSQEFVTSVVPTLEGATTVSDLDMAEMRIGRTAIKLRDLRQSLEQ